MLKVKKAINKNFAPFSRLQKHRWKEMHTLQRISAYLCVFCKTIGLKSAQIK